MRSLLVAVLVPWLVACQPAPVSTSAPEPDAAEQASGPSARWSYEIRVDEALERMDLGLCIEGPRPDRLTAGDEALAVVRTARVRGGPELARDEGDLLIDTLGEHGCVDLEIDLVHAADQSGRDSGRHGDSLMLGPDRWLWYPSVVPEDVDARARFELPDGVAATVPWPRIAEDDPQDWRRLDRTSFGWNAWIAFGQREPLRFVAADCEFEVAILDGDRRATDAGVEAWIRTAAEAGAQLSGRFPRDRVAVVVVPSPAWGSSPVLFGMARRGGGGSVMLLLNDAAEDDSLVGEWVAVHELLHLGMPLVAEAWMAEGFVTYYTHVLRARADLLDRLSKSPFESDLDHQARTALESFAAGFNVGGIRTLELASATMRKFGNYQRVYWGGAALAYDLDVSLRSASNNRRSLDDLMLELQPLASEHRRYAAADLLARMDDLCSRWAASGELDREISPSAIAAKHLSAKSTPRDVLQLRGVAVSIDQGRIRLLADPKDEVRVRTGIFVPKTRSPFSAD